MFTVCPSCSSQFRVYAYHLGAARGLVQCGFCGAQFDALSRLHDRPLADLGPQASSGPADNKPEPREPEPWFDIPALDTARPGSTRRETIDYEADAFSVMLAEEEPAQTRSRAATLFWSAGMIVLLISLAMQVLWFNRDRIYSHYPRLVPVAGRICEYFGCRVFRQLDTSRIVMLNRDVREHPRFLNALLINATIENRSVQVLPYPDIRLVLYDTNGIVSGYRQFTPHEYLGEDVAIEDGMKPDAPVHIILEIGGAGGDAVSFEFHFVYNA